MLFTLDEVQAAQGKEEAIRGAIAEAQMREVETKIPKPKGEGVGEFLKKRSHPYVTLGFGYDSNVDNVEHDAKGDMFFPGTLGLKMNFSGRDKALNLNTHLDGKYYGQRTIYNTLDAVQGLTSFINIGKYILSFSDSYNNNYIIGTRELGVKRSSVETTDISGESTAQNERRWANTSTTILGRYFNRIGFDVGYIRSDIDYEPDFSLENDRFVDTGRLNMYLRVATKTRLLFGYSHERTEYRKMPDTITNIDDYNFAVTGALSPKLTYLGRVDYKFGDAKTGFDGRNRTFTGNIGYAFTNRTNLTFNYNHIIGKKTISGLIDDASSLYTHGDTFSLTGNHRLAFNPKFNLSVKCGAELYDYPNNADAGHDQTYSFGLGLSYAFRQWIDFSLNWTDSITRTALSTDSKTIVNRDIIEFKTAARF